MSYGVCRGLFKPLTKKTWYRGLPTKQRHSVLYNLLLAGPGAGFA